MVFKGSRVNKKVLRGAFQGKGFEAWGEEGEKEGLSRFSRLK
jgi:hypothetical protein